MRVCMTACVWREFQDLGLRCGGVWRNLDVGKEDESSRGDETKASSVKCMAVEVALLADFIFRYAQNREKVTGSEVGAGAELFRL
jgi:hypothetical protein